MKEWESLVPAFTSSSIFSENLRSGDAGERDTMCLVSRAVALVFLVAKICCPGFPGCFTESRPWVLFYNVTDYFEYAYLHLADTFIQSDLQMRTMEAII